MRRAQTGFTHIIFLILAVFIIAAIGLVGWEAFLKSKPTPNVSTSNNSPSAANTAQSLNENTYQGDITQNLHLKTIKLTGVGQQGMAVDPHTGYVYVGAYSGISNKCVAGNPNRGKSYLNVVDPSVGKELVAPMTDQAPIWPAIDDQRGLVYVAASSGSVAIHKLGTGEKVRSIHVGGLPHMPALLGNVMIVSNTYDQSESYYSAINLDTDQITGNYRGPHLPHPIAVDSQKKLAYMMGVESGQVTVIDMNTGRPVSNFTLPGGVGQMALSSTRNKMVTSANSPGAAMAVFDVNSKTKLDTIGFNGAATPGTSIAIDDDSGLAFVVISDQNTIGVASLNTLKPLGYFKAGGCPYAVRLDTQRGKGYVSNSGDGSLTVFDLTSLKSAIK